MNIILTRVPDDQELDDVVIVLPLARHNFFFFWSSLLPLFSCSNQAVLGTFESFPAPPPHKNWLQLRSARPSAACGSLGLRGLSRGRGSRSRSPGLAPCALSPTWPPVLTLSSPPPPPASEPPPKDERSKSWTTFPSIFGVRFGWNRSRSRRTNREAAQRPADLVRARAHPGRQGGERRG